MTETQELLGKIAALRQRLEQAQGLARAATSAASALAGNDGAQLEILRYRAETGADGAAALDASLDEFLPAKPLQIAPTRLTSRARRVLELGRGLLDQLRPLGQVVLNDENDPLARSFRATASMVDAALRGVSTFPDEAGAQLRLSEGLEAILEEVSRRTSVIKSAVERRRGEELRLGSLADLLGRLAEGQPLDFQAFTPLAESLLAEAQDASPLHFHAAPVEMLARYVAAHSLNVAMVMARLVRTDPEFRTRPLEPVLAALLHDVGMMFVPPDILLSPTALTEDQVRIVEAHTRLGAEVVQRLRPEAPELVEAVERHHERLDGTGYPGGRRGVQIAPLTRFVAVCDVYCALITARPHRPARETRTALTDTLLLAESGALDQQCAERLLALTFYPVGTAVEMADGSLGVVVATHANRRDLSNPARPVVALLGDERGRPLPSPKIVDLGQSEGRAIVRSLSHAERRASVECWFPEWAF